MCVCVLERERKRENGVCVGIRKREKERERVVCVCVCVCVRKREKERERVWCVCVCVYVCNSYRRFICNRQPEFKSWMNQFAFYLTQILFVKVWVHLFYHQRWENSWGSLFFTRLLLLLFTPLEFFTSLLADGFSLEFEWQQVSSSLQDSSQDSDRS